MPLPRQPVNSRRLHLLGVLCGLVAGVWLGAAEAPTKLVTAGGLNPISTSLCMVAGVFAARWTFPTLLKGTSFVVTDLRRLPHLIVWALLAGALWAVANTLTVFAIRDVGLATAFPLWNANSLIGLLWGWLLFGELRGADSLTRAKVVGGTLAILAGAILLGYSTLHGGTATHPHAARGLLAAAGASLLWGTMYVPYRKAYLSGLNPLSFITLFTLGELGTMLALAATLNGGLRSTAHQLTGARHLLFWLFLGGFGWVVGDLFQQFATKYLGIGRGIPLSNTNQLWGLAWGALVFGELASASPTQRLFVLGGSAIMIAGTLAISTAAASGDEALSRDAALLRECRRFNLDPEAVLLTQNGGPSFPDNPSPDDPSPDSPSATPTAPRRRWWDLAILWVSCAVFIFLAFQATAAPLPLHRGWAAILALLLLVSLIGGTGALWRTTDFT